jgi:hypothetical protein
MADVIGNGDPPNILDPAATAAETMLYKHATVRHMSYSVATTRLAADLVDSVCESNRIALYVLLPHQVIEAMITKHGIFTGGDIAKLRESSPL